MKLTAIISALFQSPQAIAPSVAGSTSITLPALARRKVLTISPDAGAGTYTYVVYLPIADRLAGDELHVRLHMPASTNPTIELRDATDAGTLLKTWTGTGTAFEDCWLVVFNVGAWI